MTRELLIKMARDVISHGKANTIAKADDFYKMPSSVYFDEQRNQDEKSVGSGIYPPFHPSQPSLL